MSGFGGRATVPRRPHESPEIANAGHSLDNRSHVYVTLSQFGQIWFRLRQTVFLESVFYTDLSVSQRSRAEIVPFV